MQEKKPKISPKKPKGIFNKPLKADFKDLFKALTKGITHTVTGNWEELANDAVESLSAIGLTTDTEELSFLLIKRSLIRSLFELISEIENQSFLHKNIEVESIIQQLNIENSINELQIDKSFFNHPTNISLIKETQPILLNWLINLGMQKAPAEATVNRLPTYFVYALNQEWRKNLKSYKSLQDTLNTPFTRAGELEWAWQEYSASLQDV